MAVDTSVIGKPTGAWKVTVERGPGRVLRGRGAGHEPGLPRRRRRRRPPGFDAHPRAADVHVRDAVLGRVRRGPAARPDRRPEPDAHDHGRAVRPRARWCCTASRSSSTTARSRSATCSIGEGKIIDIYEKETDSARHDVRRHPDAVDGRGDRARRSSPSSSTSSPGLNRHDVHERSATHGPARGQGRDHHRRGPGHRPRRTPSGSSPRAPRSSSPRSTRTAPRSAMKQLDGPGDVDLPADRHLRRAVDAGLRRRDRRRGSAPSTSCVNNAALYYDIDNADTTTSTCRRCSR